MKVVLDTEVEALRLAMNGRISKLFYDWAMHNGYSPELSIDRIDNDGDYCPENCRWADDITQANNKCTNRIIEYNGVTHTVKEWSRLFGVHYETLRHRISRNDMRDFEEYFRDK